ncbi:hypothetical protein AB0N09_04925, partial [Streptomyces erythrochromogenes]
MNRSAHAERERREGRSPDRSLSRAEPWGTRSAVQNSGLGYSLNVLTSLNLIYDLHVPLIVSWR